MSLMSRRRELMAAVASRKPEPWVIFDSSLGEPIDDCTFSRTAYSSGYTTHSISYSNGISMTLRAASSAKALVIACDKAFTRNELKGYRKICVEGVFPAATNRYSRYVVFCSVANYGAENSGIVENAVTLQNVTYLEGAFDLSEIGSDEVYLLIRLYSRSTSSTSGNAQYAITVNKIWLE